MSIEQWAGLIVSILTILGIISAFAYKIYKLMRNSIRGDLVPMITSNYTTLDEKIADNYGALDKKIGINYATLDAKITEENKKSRNYMGSAFEEKLKEYEDNNEKIRTVRSEKYMGVIDNIKESITRVTQENQKNTEIILKGLDHIKEQISENNIKTAKNETRIDNIEKAKK